MHNYGTMTISGATIANNSVNDFGLGGGVSNGGTMTISGATTIAINSAASVRRALGPPPPTRGRVARV